MGPRQIVLPESRETVEDKFTFEWLHKAAASPGAKGNYKVKAKREEGYRKNGTGRVNYPKTIGDIMECRKKVKDVLRCFSGSSKLVFQHFLASNVCVNPCANYGGKSSGEAGIVRMLCADTFGEMSDEERKKSLRASSGFVRMIADATKKGGVPEKDAPVAYLFRQTKFDNLLEQIEKFKEARIANPNFFFFPSSRTRDAKKKEES